MRSLFPFEHASQDLAAFLSLPDLVGILVLVQLEEFLIGLQGWFRLPQIIVAERTDEPTAGSRSFKLINPAENGERSTVIFRKIVSGTQILPIIDVFLIEPDSCL